MFENSLGILPSREHTGFQSVGLHDSREFNLVFFCTRTTELYQIFGRFSPRKKIYNIPQSKKLIKKKKKSSFILPIRTLGNLILKKKSQCILIYRNGSSSRSDWELSGAYILCWAPLTCDAFLFYACSDFLDLYLFLESFLQNNSEVIGYIKLEYTSRIHRVLYLI